jgi:hypothetical protein
MADPQIKKYMFLNKMTPVIAVIRLPTAMKNNADLYLN